MAHIPMFLLAPLLWTATAWPVSAASPGFAAADSVRPPAYTVDSTLAGPERWVDYLWVVRTSLVSPQAIDRAIARGKAMGVRGLLVQVVGRADSYYRSDLLPRAESLPVHAGETPFDPLGYLLPRAHDAGLEVHAWMNSCLVWSAAKPPRDPRHVVNAHPDWIARMRDGRRMDRLGPVGYKRLKIEGAYLSPANPAVRTWMAAAAAEIISRYPIDGVHLDYIRHPGIDVGYDGASRTAFALRAGVDPMRIQSFSAARRAVIDSAFDAFQAEQVTLMVCEVRDSLRSRRTDAHLTAAVKSDLRQAKAVGQEWPKWIADGLVDEVFPMCYAPTTQVVLDELLEASRRFGTERVVPGMAVYNAAPSTVAAHLKGARALGYPRLALYSSDALEAHPGYWPALRDRLGSAAGIVH